MNHLGVRFFFEDRLIFLFESSPHHLFVFPSRSQSGVWGQQLNHRDMLHHSNVQLACVSASAAGYLLPIVARIL